MWNTCPKSKVNTAHIIVCNPGYPRHRGGAQGWCTGVGGCVCVCVCVWRGGMAVQGKEHHLFLNILINS